MGAKGPSGRIVGDPEGWVPGVWLWASVFSAVKGLSRGSASHQQGRCEDSRPHSGDTWGLAQRWPEAWETPPGWSRAPPGVEPIGARTLPLLPERPQPWEGHCGSGDLAARGQHERGGKPLQERRKGLSGWD